MLCYKVQPPRSSVYLQNLKPTYKFSPDDRCRYIDAMHIVCDEENFPDANQVMHAESLLQDLSGCMNAMRNCRSRLKFCELELLLVQDDAPRSLFSDDTHSLGNSGGKASRAHFSRVSGVFSRRSGRFIYGEFQYTDGK